MFSAVLIAALTGLVCGNPVPQATSASSKAVCTKLPYNVLVPLSIYPPVVSWCSSRFPVADVLSTSMVTPTTTSITTIWTTATIPTTSTAVTTVSSTTTVTTITIAAEDQFAKRAASTTLDARASASCSSRWKTASSMLIQLAKASAVASTACSCMMTAKTKLATVAAASAVTVVSSVTSITTTTSFEVVQTTQTVEVDVTASAAPQAPAETISARDGSKFVIVRNILWSMPDTNIVGINPHNNIESMEACTEICMQQGTKCVGTSYTQSSKTCLTKKKVKSNVPPSFGTDSTIRMTGPAGVNTQQLQKRNFADGNLGAWTSTSSQLGGSFSVVNGAANLTLPLSKSTGTSFNPRDTAYLQQAISARAGQNFFFQINYGYTLNFNSSATPYQRQMVSCNVNVSTDKDTLMSIYYTSRNGNLNFAQLPAYASGILSGDASYLRTEFVCNGGQDASFALNSISLKTFDPSTGTNVIVPDQKQVLQNTQFTDNGSISPWKIVVSNDPNNTPTISPGSIRLCLGPQAQFQRIGTLSQPGLPLLELDQPYRVKARVDVDIPNNAGTCNLSLFMSNNVATWNSGDVSNSRGWDVDVRQDSIRNDATEFGMQAFCSSTTVTMCLTLSNVELIYNV